MKTSPLTASVTLWLAAALGCLIGLVPLTAAADTKVPPQLSITVDDGQTDATPGAELSYAITVSNLGAGAVENLTVSHTVPSGAVPGAASPKAIVKGQQMRWIVDLKPGKSVTLRSGVAVAKRTPDDLLRFATVACAQLDRARQPSVCASDSDQLPAGAAADQQRADLQPVAGPPSRAVWYAAGAGLLVLVAAALVVVARRRSRPTR